MSQILIKTQCSNMQEEMEHQQQTSLDGFGDNTFVDSPQPNVAEDTDFITNNKNINIIRTGLTKSSHLDINETNSLFCQSNIGNMETDVGSEGSSGHNNADHHKTTKTIGVNLRVTGQCCQGGRKYMEDFFSVAYQQTDNMRDLEYAFIGIYDGHGGSEAATFAKEHLMMEIINQKLFWSDSDQDVLRAIREGYIATHFAMWREQENWPKTTNGLLSTAGTTATVAFIRNEKIYIGHVGDSGVVLGYQDEGENFWRAKQLTTDHKPESPAERHRIMQAGGKVGVKSGVPRVVWTRPRNTGHRGPVRANTPVEEIPFLAVARSLGDLWSYNAEFNEFVVSPDPDVQVIEINPKTFRCLIFGTDGLWNVVTPQKAVDTVCTREKMNESIAQNKQTNDGKNVPWINPSKGLVELALRTWSDKKMRADNTSVVTVILYPPACSLEKSTETGEPETKRNKIKSVNDIDFATVLDNRTSFQEISEKYLRPERFRNINNPNYNNEQLYWNSSDHEAMRTNNWFWRCDTDTETEDMDACEENALRHVGQSLQSFDELSKPRTLFTNTTTRVLDIDNAEKLNNVDHSDLYVNSFAETYNSLLDAQISRSTKEQQVPVGDQAAATSTPLSSSTGLHMQQILQEQQMYQQQCMSGEDGYMLTTLETRREQQRCGGMQTFKVFDQAESSNFHADNNIQVNIREDSISYMVNSIEAKELEICDNLLKELPEQEEKVVDKAKEQEPKAHIKEKAVQETPKAEKKTQEETRKERKVSKEREEAKEKKQHEVQQQKQQKRQRKETQKVYEECELESAEPSLVEDEDGILEGKRAESIHKERVHRECFVKIVDVSYDDDEDDAEKIATPTDFEEHIDEIEILADKPELVIESGATSSKPATRAATSSAKTRNDFHAKAKKSPYYMPRRPQSQPQPQTQPGAGLGPGLRAYNGWEPGKSTRLPTEEEFREYIQTNMDYAATSAFYSFIAAMKRHFPGFNDSTILSKIFESQKMHHFNSRNPPNRNNMSRNKSNNFTKAQTPNPASKGTMPNTAGKGNVPFMSGKSSIPTTSGKCPTAATGGRVPMSNMGSKGATTNAAGRKKVPKHEDVGEMLVNYYFGGLLRARKKATKEKNGQNNDEESSDDDYPENLEYYESIIDTWTPYMNLLEDPEFQRRLLKNKELMTSLMTKVKNSSAAKNATKTTSETTTTTTTMNGTTVPESPEKTGDVQGNASNTVDKDKIKLSENPRTTTTTPAKATDKKESSLKAIPIVVAKKPAQTTIEATRTLPTQTVASAKIKCEKDVQTPIVAHIAKVRTTPKISQTINATKTATATKSSCMKKLTVETTITPAMGSVKTTVGPTTIKRASKRSYSLDLPANTKTTVGLTSSSTATSAEDIIGTIPVKRIKR